MKGPCSGLPLVRKSWPRCELDFQNVKEAHVLHHSCDDFGGHRPPAIRGSSKLASNWRPGRLFSAESLCVTIEPAADP